MSVAVGDLDPEATAKRAMERNEFRYIVKFPFKQGMEGSERLPILRRLDALAMDR